MPKSTRLRQTIHSHWLKYRPQMVEELTRTNRLAQALRQAEERTVDLLYELVSHQENAIPGGLGTGDGRMADASRPKPARRNHRQ